MAARAQETYDIIRLLILIFAFITLLVIFLYIAYEKREKPEG